MRERLHVQSAHSEDTPDMIFWDNISKTIPANRSAGTSGGRDRKVQDLCDCRTGTRRSYEMGGHKDRKVQRL